MDISYLQLFDNCRRSPPIAFPRTLLFDMGCANYKTTNRATGGGPSIPLFLKLYKRRCMTFDIIYGWEAKEIKHWWRHVPLDVKVKTHFYNTPITRDEFSKALDLVKKDDFVAVKLDIDNTNVEMEIIDEILKRPHLVDELFFEYHYHIPNIDFGWGNLSIYKHVHNTTSAIRLLRTLRRNGIRAHFWV